jgi:hypothetical protein
VLLALLAMPGWAAVPEYDVKAALIYRISKFVKWPEGAFAGTAGTLHLCIIGHDDFGASLDRLAGRRVQGQAISIERLASVEQYASNCQLAFISRSERGRLPYVLGVLGRNAVLTISDIDNFAAAGGMIGFTTTESKLAFQINPGASRNAGLQIGAQLLQLATLVGDVRAGSSP